MKEGLGELVQPYTFARAFGARDTLPQPFRKGALKTPHVREPARQRMFGAVFHMRAVNIRTMPPLKPRISPPHWVVFATQNLVACGSGWVWGRGGTPFAKVHKKLFASFARGEKI